MNLRNIFATLGKEFKLGFSLKMIEFLVKNPYTKLFAVVDSRNF